MRGWGGRGVGVAVLAAVLGTGCGGGAEGARVEGISVPVPPVLTPPASSEEVPGVTAPDASDTPPPASASQQLKEYPLPDGAWPTPDASTLGFAVPACVPVTLPTGPRLASPCEARTLRPDGTLSRRERFDAAGHLLEEVTFAADGRESYRTENLWVDGLQVRSVSGAPVTGVSTVYEWAYDAEGRTVRSTTRLEPGGGTGYEERTFYDAQGRIERVEQPSWVRRYVYGAQGRLESVDWDQPGDPWLLGVERYTYHANGQLKSYAARPPTMGDADDREYDEAGRLLSSRHCTFHGCWDATHAYGADSQPTRVHEVMGTDTVDAEWDRLFVYDSEGRRVVEASVGNVQEWTEGVGPRRYQQRQVHRFFYACETGDLLREELDADADGTPDGWRELERDAAGNLVTERFTGTAANPEQGRREYDSVCH